MRAGARSDTALAVARTARRRTLVARVVAAGIVATTLITATAGAPAPSPASAPASAPAPAPAPATAVQPGFDGMHVMQGTPAYAPTPLGPIHYWKLGEGPAVLLLHAGPLFSVQFAKVQPLLAKAGRTVIAADLPGFGFSPRPDHPPTGEEYAASVAALLDHAGIERAAVLGILTGGVVALALASHRPQHVSCVMLQSVPVYSPAERDRKINEVWPDSRIYHDGRHLGARWSEKLRRQRLDAASPEALQWLFIGELLTGDIQNWYGERTGSTFITRTFDTRRAILELKVPALVIGRRGEDAGAPTHRTLALRPDFEKAQLEVGNALVPYDHAQEWAEAVERFLRARC